MDETQKMKEELEQLNSRLAWVRAEIDKKNRWITDVYSSPKERYPVPPEKKEEVHREVETLRGELAQLEPQVKSLKTLLRLAEQRGNPKLSPQAIQAQKDLGVLLSRRAELVSLQEKAVAEVARLKASMGAEVMAGKEPERLVAEIQKLEGLQLAYKAGMEFAFVEERRLKKVIYEGRNVRK